MSDKKKIAVIPPREPDDIRTGKPPKAPVPQPRPKPQKPQKDRVDQK